MTIPPPLQILLIYACILAAFLLGRWWNRTDIEITEAMFIELNDLRLRELVRAERTMLELECVPVDDDELPLFARPSREVAA